VTCIEVTFPEICEQRQTDAYTERATPNGLTDSASLGKNSSTSDLFTRISVTEFYLYIMENVKSFQIRTDSIRKIYIS